MKDELILVPKKKWEYACQCRLIVKRLEEQEKNNHICKVSYPDNNIAPQKGSEVCYGCRLQKILEREEEIRTDSDRELGRFY